MAASTLSETDTGVYVDDYDIYSQSHNFSTEGCGPFTKISNPFTTGDNHAD